jgi:hypothetical protein
MMDRNSESGRQRICLLAEQEFPYAQDMVVWLGTMGGLHGKQCSKAAAVFDMLFN